jgi:deoxyribonuclease-4
MRFGPAGYPQSVKDSKDKGTDALDLLKRLGLDALEMEFVHGIWANAATAKDIGAKAKELNIRLSAHAPYYISFNSETPKTREKSVSYVTDTVRAAHNLGAYIIVIHAAHYGKTPPEEATDSVITGLNKCKEIMDDENIKDVILGLETMGRPSAWGTLKEIGEVMDSVSGVRPVLDVGHVHARYNGSLRTKEDMSALTEEFFALAGDMPHFHISCLQYTVKGEKDHIPLSAKDPDMSLLADALSGCKKDCTFICESPLLEEDALNFKRMFPGQAKL